jgi:Flp pilus assembly protein TadD
MPKRQLKVISHSVLTNHRIIVKPGEPFPEEAFNMTTPELPDLVHLSATADEKQQSVSPLMLLEAHRQVMLSHPEYRQRYWAVAKQLEAVEPENVSVLQALADLALQEKSQDGAAKAIRYLRAARSHGSTQPADVELLARLLILSKHESEAIDVLKQGIVSIPYDAELYRLLARAYLSLNQTQQACDAITKGRQIFPQDASIRKLSEDCARNGRKN